ncbi:MAG: prepilin-type N-terminal cleavage/methylation domain-containing protein [Lachnospiraceae bacterium]|nr:prepilin-type N-terminal cleavage/methylation domain-containing protein [Lachnospiraceae bacterium]
MNECGLKNNNKGFSLIELIVVVAIMSLMIGIISLSMSLLFGAEAKSGIQKLSAQLDEVKTGSMSRYTEDLTFIYVADPASYDWAEKEGYYVVKQLKTMKKDTSTGMPGEVGLGVEHRYICKDNVAVTFNYDDGSGTIASYPVVADGTTSFTIRYNRTTGLYDDVTVGATLLADGTIDSSVSSISGSVPSSITMVNGAKTYEIDFIKETGKHRWYLVD